MTILQSLMHYGSYALGLYALYVLAGALAFGYFIWRKVFRGTGARPRKLERRQDGSDPHLPR
ncbi:hypothetical protein [Herbaspirillum sp.]|uniref:hypothetical protein n=1 Tax=Herbaspirillum sp. TaxID=1890675 RepID=UPI0031DE19D8